VQASCVDDSCGVEMVTFVSIMALNFDGI
jgi:hypothetical protein